MLTLYRSSKNGSLTSDSDEDKPVIPAGQPYLTKINGELVMAREKRPRTASAAVDLLGEAFGVRSNSFHKRAKSVDPYPVPLMIGGIPYVPQSNVTYSTPLPQQQFPVGFIASYQESDTSSRRRERPQSMYAPTRYSVTPQIPTAEDFDLLKRIDADYNSKKKGKGHARIDSASLCDKDHNGKGTKVTVTIEKHVCGNCGRLRSRKYHMENPLKPGEVVLPAFCRKCQKDTSSASECDLPKKSTSGSKDEKGKEKLPSNRRSPHNKQSNKKSGSCETDNESPNQSNSAPSSAANAFGKKKKQKSGAYDQPKAYVPPTSRLSLIFRKISRQNIPIPVDSSLVVEEVEESADDEVKRNHRTKKCRGRDKPQSYVVVEEEDSEREETPRGRLRLRFKESDTTRRPSSPPPSQPDPRRSQPRKHSKGVDLTDDKGHSRSRESLQNSYDELPPSGFRYVQAPTQYQSEEPPRQRRTRRNSTREPLFRTDKFSNPPRSEYEKGSPRSMFSRDDSFGSSNSSRSHDSSRRRRERSRADDMFAHPAHNIHPQPSDEKVVVTETYVYRPRRQSRERGEEDERYFDKDGTRHSTFDNAKHGRSAEDRAYYHNNWVQEDSRHLAGEPGLDSSRRRSYRRGIIRDSELYSEPTAPEEVDYRRAYNALHENLPRAPTPPYDSPFEETYPTEPLYQPNPEYVTTRHRISPSNHSPPAYDNPRRNRDRSTSSNHRPPFVRETTEGGTEKPLIPSPRPRSISRERDPFYGEPSESSLVERERLAESNVQEERHQERHVRFEEIGSEVDSASYDSDREAEAERTVTFEELGSVVDGTGYDAGFDGGFAVDAEEPVQWGTAQSGGGDTQW